MSTRRTYFFRVQEICNAKIITFMSVPPSRSQAAQLDPDDPMCRCRQLSRVDVSNLFDLGSRGITTKTAGFGCYSNVIVYGKFSNAKRRDRILDEGHIMVQWIHTVVGGEN